MLSRAGSEQQQLGTWLSLFDGFGGPIHLLPLSVSSDLACVLPENAKRAATGIAFDFAGRGLAWWQARGAAHGRGLSLGPWDEDVYRRPVPLPGPAGPPHPSCAASRATGETNEYGTILRLFGSRGFCQGRRGPAVLSLPCAMCVAGFASRSAVHCAVRRSASWHQSCSAVVLARFDRQRDTQCGGDAAAPARLPRTACDRTDGTAAQRHLSTEGVAGMMVYLATAVGSGGLSAKLESLVEPEC